MQALTAETVTPHWKLCYERRSIRPFGLAQPGLSRRSAFTSGTPTRFCGNSRKSRLPCNGARFEALTYAIEYAGASDPSRAPATYLRYGCGADHSRVKMCFLHGAEAGEEQLSPWPDEDDPLACACGEPLTFSRVVHRIIHEQE